MQPIPSDVTIILRTEKGFKAEWQSLYTVQNRHWLNYVARTQNINLQTQYKGREMALGKKWLRVDGWDSTNPTTYLFHGCKFHGHPNCLITKGEEFHPKTSTPLAELYATTLKRRTYLEEECHVRVVEMWECELQKLKKTEPLVQQNIDETFKHIKASYTKQKSQPQKMEL